MRVNALLANNSAFSFIKSHYNTNLHDVLITPFPFNTNEINVGSAVTLPILLWARSHRVKAEAKKKKIKEKTTNIKENVRFRLV